MTPTRTKRAAADLAAAEGRALAALLADLGDADWDRVTDCPEWTVRDMVAHLVGQAEGVRRPWVALRRVRTGKRRWPDRIGLDAYTAQQIAEHAGQSGPALVAAFVDGWPRAVTAMRRTPGPVRRMGLDPGIPGAARITVGYLYDSILPRDLWMHRVDLSRATGREMVVGGHDASIVDDVVADLTRDWTGPPVRLELTGPAGGGWHLGTGPARSTVSGETVDYLRTLAGRQSRPALVAVAGDPAAVTAVAAARVMF
jgi:uncharacterized protein (TIGR03083 family)